MIRSLFLTAFLTTLALGMIACGDDDSTSGQSGGPSSGSSTVDTSKPENRSGPASLDGFDWKLPPITINNIELQGQFNFTQTDLNVKTTCNGSLSAMASSPVKYSYNANILEDAKTVEGSGENTCEAFITKGMFDFTIENGDLVGNQGSETFRFKPEGNTSGLYGTWIAQQGDLILRWSIGNGIIRVESDCTKLNGLKAVTQANTDFINYVEVLEDKKEEVEDGGLTCEASINMGKYSYRYENKELVLIDAMGAEIRFKP